jgi:hypothetical protein
LGNPDLSNINGNAYIYNQENRHLIFSTNHTVPGAWDNTRERMRITCLGAPTLLPDGTVGIYNLIPLPGDITRVSISYDPAAPVTRPMSLLHLGYNTGQFANTVGATDGWRPWMDIGAFISSGTDNMYVGLMSYGADRQDAVINWGDNEPLSFPPGSGPDNLKFIFTATQSSVGNFPPATGQNGVEAMRMTPTSTGVNTGIGGNPVTNPYWNGLDNPSQTLEVNSMSVVPGPTNSGLRFTDMVASTTTVAPNPGIGVLSVNENGDVIYVQASNSQFGVQCPSSNPSIDGLQYNTEKPFNGHNFVFSGNAQGLNKNNFGIGISTCIPSAKLDVLQASGSTQGSIGLKVINSDPKSLGAYISSSGYAALFVPQFSGKVNIGYPDNFGGWQGSAGLLNVNGDIWVQNSGYFLNGTYVISDSSLKQNLDIIQNASQLLTQLIPYTYNFRQDIAGIDLPSIKQYGFCAQQVQSVIPEIVKETVIPGIIDTAGNEMFPERTILAMNPEQLIPIIVASLQEQNLKIDSVTDNLIMSAENGLHVDSADGNKIKLGGKLTENTDIKLKKNLLFVSNDNMTGQVCVGSSFTPQSEAFVVNNKTWVTSAKFFNIKSNTTNNIAASFEANGSLNENYGAQFYGKGNDNQTNYGATFEASGKAKVNYAVFAKADGGGANYAGYFNGNLYASSYINLPSDSKLKENIQPLTNALDVINQLQPKTFTFKTADFPSINLPSGQQYGLIAQDVETIIPNVVSTTFHPAVYDSTGAIIYDTLQSKSLNYDAFIPILISAVKELNTKNDSVTSSLNDQIDSLKQVISTFNDRFDELESRISQCCGDNSKSMIAPSNITDVNLENQQTVVLNQNVPNPFAEHTTISYFIPENSGYAQMIFTDQYGKIIKTVDLTSTGDGMINVFADNLSSGVYTYSLVIDGKVVDSKKMVCTK